MRLCPFFAEGKKYFATKYFTEKRTENTFKMNFFWKIYFEKSNGKQGRKTKFSIGETLRWRIRIEKFFHCPKFTSTMNGQTDSVGQYVENETCLGREMIKKLNCFTRPLATPILRFGESIIIKSNLLMTTTNCQWNHKIFNFFIIVRPVQMLVENNSKSPKIYDFTRKIFILYFTQNTKNYITQFHSINFLKVCSNIEIILLQANNMRIWVNGKMPCKNVDELHNQSDEWDLSWVHFGEWAENFGERWTRKAVLLRTADAQV